MAWLSQDQNDAVSPFPSAIPSRRSCHSWTAMGVGARSVDAREDSNPDVSSLLKQTDLSM